ncbi:putative Chloroplastic lipocalin [Cocos nucifera]|nr:putative Chloroplastic lipocalin [Cocos nucifera]
MATNNDLMLKSDSMSDEGNGMLMMRGMTAKNFDPVRYSGRWFEVASLKRGFAGQGQEDCHCTQGIYMFDAQTLSIQVDTFCVHGGPDGYITGIRGKVQCISEEDTEKAETDLEKQKMIKEKCYLRFPTLPFIPKEPYDVIATDYDSFSLVSGAKDKSFIQDFVLTREGREKLDN